MAGTGKRKSSEQKQAEQQQTAGVATPVANTLGTAGNPIQGPPLVDFSRGPEVNYTIPQHRVDAGEPQIGSQANPLAGPPIGSSPGVQNPGEVTITGPAANNVVLDETALSDDQRSMHNIRMRAAHSTPSAAGANTPATLVQTDENGKTTQTTIVPRFGETAEQAIARIAKDGADSEPLPEETELTKLQAQQTVDTADLTTKQQEARTKLGEKHQKANDARVEEGTKLADKHREELAKDSGEATVARHSTERRDFDNETTDLQNKQQEEFEKLQADEQTEAAKLAETQKDDLAKQTTKLSEAQQKERDKAAAHDGPTHRRGAPKTTHAPAKTK